MFVSNTEEIFMTTTNYKNHVNPKRQYAIFLICFFVVIISIILLCSKGEYQKQKSGPIPNSVYVWQRNWNGAVAEALGKASQEMSCFGVLSMEVSFKQNQIDNIVSVPVNYEALKSTQKPVALAFRIGSFPGDFRKDSETTSFLGDIACSLIEEAIENSVEPAELHIDFDCAESKLDSYRELVRVLKEKVQNLSEALDQNQPVPVIITALPCWLKHRQFKSLVQEADGFILQVHSLERPKNSDTKIVLCDAASSIKWVKKAARLGVPFRVALPTYGCIVGFDSKGQYLGITTEGPSRNWPQGTSLRMVSSDARAISELVRKWQKARPNNMLGIIWYRLPIETDQFNWNWDTLQMVMNGREPAGDVKVEIDYSQAGFAKILLVNTGQLDYLPNNNVRIRCEYTNIVAADGMNGFVFDGGNQSEINFKFNNQNSLIRIKPGESLLIGWLSFNESARIDAYVSKMF